MSVRPAGILIQKDANHAGAFFPHFFYCIPIFVPNFLMYEFHFGLSASADTNADNHTLLTSFFFF